MLKNRTVISLICIILAVLLCFVVAPFVTGLFSGTESVVTLTSSVSAGEKIERSLLGTAHVSAADLISGKYVTDPDAIVGKYAKSFLYSGIVTNDMFEVSVTDSDVRLQSLKSGEFAMSVTIQSLAGGLSNKVRAGDVVSVATTSDKNIESLLSESEKAYINNALKYVEVIAVTTEDGTDVTGETGGLLGETVTFKLIDERQVSALLNCEEGTLHIAFAARDKKQGAKYLEAQKTYFEELDKAEAERTQENENEIITDFDGNGNGNVNIGDTEPAITTENENTLPNLSSIIGGIMGEERNNG